MDFLRKNKRISFLYDGKNFMEYKPQIHIEEKNNELITSYIFDDGLKVTNVAKKIEKYDAYEWVNILENTGDKNTRIISELWDCNCDFDFEYEDVMKDSAWMPDKDSMTKIYSPCGSNWSCEEFYCNADCIKHNSYINHLYPKSVKVYSGNEGRSSDEYAPFFNIHKNGKGIITAIGWTGRWKAQITRNAESVNFKSKVEDTEFYLEPGEKIRTSSFVVMKYESDFIDSQNKWRRLLKEVYAPVDKLPFCTGLWGGMSSDDMLKRIDIISKNKLPFEYIWMDAGWAGNSTKPSPDEYEGDWYKNTGDWNVNTFLHPDGLLEVSKAIHNSNYKYILWFEPERAIKGTNIVNKHPEYFLISDDENDTNCLLNLGNEDAWNYCYETLTDIISRLNVDFYRQDFNMNPLPIWRKNDCEGRKGMTEIKHINGLYKLWDALLDRFTDLIIDNCASGGKRLDIETLRRSVPLWRSDAQCPANYPAEFSQNHNMSFSTWMPYSGTGCGREYDLYRVRSAYAGGMTSNYFFSENDSCDLSKEKIEWIRKIGNEYLKVRPYFYEDVYPLTEVSDKLDVWSAVQFNRPLKNDGILQVFKRENAPYTSASFNLRGIDKTKRYVFTDADTDESFTVSGEEIAQNGLSVFVSEKKVAKLYFYKAE